MMTKNQINAAIGALLDQAGMHLKTAQESTGEAAQPTWIAQMTASMVCSDIAAALLAVRRMSAMEEGYNAPSQENIG